MNIEDISNSNLPNDNLLKGNMSNGDMPNGSLSSGKLLNGNVSRISILADRIKKNADILASFADSEGQEPSLEASGQPLRIPNIEKDTLWAKTNLLDSIKELQCLVKGPIDILMDIGVCLILASLRFTG